MRLRASVGDDGAAAVWAVALTSLLLVAALVVAIVGDVLAARSRAASAADLAALAAAPYASSSLACSRAAEVVRANGAELAGCVVADGEVEVAARVAVADPWRRWIRLLAGATDAQAAARAGLR